MREPFEPTVELFERLRHREFGALGHDLVQDFAVGRGQLVEVIEAWVVKGHAHTLRFGEPSSAYVIGGNVVLSFELFPPFESPVDMSPSARPLGPATAAPSSRVGGVAVGFFGKNG